MAQPISSYPKNEWSEEERKEIAIDALQEALVEQDEAIEKLIDIVGDLQSAGILEALQAVILAKEKIAEIAVQQVSKDSVVNVINHALGVSSVLSSLDPNISKKVMKGMVRGLEEAELYRNSPQKWSLFQLITALNDPAIQTSLQFGLHFLKGMGKELQADEKK